MKKLLVIYNTCGISNDGSRYVWYANALQSLVFQTLFSEWSDDYKVVVSSCKNSDAIQQSMVRDFGDNLSYNFIEDNVPLSVSFNHTVDKCVSHFGEFNAYLYLDSGISFWDPSRRYDAIGRLYETHIGGPNAITAAMPSNDDGSSWWGIRYTDGVDYKIPVGKATNMHCQIFGNEWRTAYKKILPDIFASNCMESVFGMMCSALSRDYLMTSKIHVLHNHSLDGASIGQRDPSPDRFPMSKMFPVGGLLYKTERDMDERYRAGHALGFGWEECAEYWRHDPDKFDASGYAKSSELKNFLRREMFLSESEFDYSKIKSLWVPGK